MRTSLDYSRFQVYLTIEVLTDNDESANMNKQHNSLKSIGKNVESKEEERRLLCCNKANVRSSSLGFNSNTLESEKMQLDYLASILVEIFLEQQRNGNKLETGSNILPGINEGAS